MKFHAALMFAVLALAAAAGDPANAGSIFTIAALATALFAVSDLTASRAEKPQRGTPARRLMWAACLATGAVSMMLIAALITSIAVSLV